MGLRDVFAEQIKEWGSRQESKKFVYLQGVQGVDGWVGKAYPFSSFRVATCFVALLLLDKSWMSALRHLKLLLSFSWGKDVSALLQDVWSFALWIQKLVYCLWRWAGSSGKSLANCAVSMRIKELLHFEPRMKICYRCRWALLHTEACDEGGVNGRYFLNFMQSCIKEAISLVQWFSLGGTSEHPHKGSTNSKNFSALTQ